ncbi:hypothetical protein PFUGPA_05618 [Plasmodium falciparum Palo Alto/Uganda]|uniref:Uncharacterized protein n=1 Tax=Plasmodium falciparum (isolate Palo Alto / Uganda) TaxID=57270 RepID=W4ITE3_PLAFP|nr:hypothetical protein PFUGPA_05618 [Plasmodium falciparum Palo Alto/Uganda]
MIHSLNTYIRFITLERFYCTHKIHFTYKIYLSYKAYNITYKIYNPYFRFNIVIILLIYIIGLRWRTEEEIIKGKGHWMIQSNVIFFANID